MTHTPSLGRRVVLLGVAVVAIGLLVVNAVVYLALRASLNASLDDLLAERAATVRAEAEDVRADGGDAADLARRLQARGLRARVTDADGGQFVAAPPSPLVGQGLPAAGGDDREVTRAVDLPAGWTAQVLARASGVDEALQRLLLIQVAGSLLAMALAAFLLARSARLALHPVGDIAAAAQRTAAGRRGERLQPDRPGTELGRMAAAYDAMLDALEAGQQVADRAERRTGVLEARWRQVLEVAQEAYVAVDGEGTIVDWNRRSEQVFGYVRDEALGRSVADLVVERQLPWTPEQVAAMTPDRLGEPFELDFADRSGAPFPAQCTVWGVERRGGTVVHMFVRDVTERRRAEEAAALLRAVIEGTADAIVTRDLDGRILTWNAGAERTFGWTAAEALGRSDDLIVPEDARAEFEELREVLCRGEHVPEVETERLSRGGVRVPVALRLSPVQDAEGRVVAISAMARDVTEQRWMAETLDSTLVALQAAADEARASEEATRRFLADAAHQLRTPIAGIRACAETLLRGGSSPEDADRLLATMVREISRAARLISSLLQMARLDQGLPLTAGPVDVVALCADEVERLSLLSPDLDVRLDVRSAPPGRLELDGAACQEILSNLGDNARRHAVGQIAVVVDAGADEVRIGVVDDGPGVPEELCEQVFERFASLDGKGGSGLGLPIGRALARAMGGDLVYEAGFVIRLPVGSANPSDAAPLAGGSTLS
jgi:PAS domain S-box-containing protein